MGNHKMIAVELEKPKTSVPGPYLGYALQPVRLCFHLLDTSSGDAVSLEHLDDTSIHYQNGDTTLEQTKSALAGNPASDRSPELWKSLANWADLCSASSVDSEKAIFRYYVTPLKQGALVEKLTAATTDQAAEELLTGFKKPTFVGKKGVGAEPQISRFLSHDDSICIAVIKRFEFLSEPCPLEPIKSKLRATLPDTSLDDFCSAAIGLAKDGVEKLIRAKTTPILDSAIFQKKFQAFVRKYDFSNLLNSTTAMPAEQQIEGIKFSRPLFVKQLEAVEASETLLASAISDFLRTTADKTKWAADGEIVEHSLDEMDGALVRRHGLIRDEIEDVQGSCSPQDRGRRLYRRCAELQLPLEGRTVPDYFVSGEYNCLAENCRLGWHPEFKTMFPGS